MTRKTRDFAECETHGVTNFEENSFKNCDENCEIYKIGTITETRVATTTPKKRQAWTLTELKDKKD